MNKNKYLIYTKFKPGDTIKLLYSFGIKKYRTFSVCGVITSVYYDNFLKELSTICVSNGYFYFSRIQKIVSCNIILKEKYNKK